MSHCPPVIPKKENIPGYSACKYYTGSSVRKCRGVIFDPSYSPNCGKSGRADGTLTYSATIYPGLKPKAIITTVPTGLLYDL